MANDEHEFRPEPLPGFEPEPVPKKGPLRWWICIAIGIASAIVGLLPWLVRGMHLPLQAYWAPSASAETMPIVLLPFSYYAVIVIFGIIVMGSAVAGVSTRATRSLERRGGPFWIAMGLLAVQVLAVVQTSLVVLDGMEVRTLSWIYLAAMVGIAVVSIVIGVPVLLLIADAPRAGATIGISVASVAVAAWLWAFVHPVTRPASGLPEFTTDILHWAPPVIVGIGLAWGGLNTVGRILAAPVCLAILWVAPTVMIAAGTAAAHPQLLDLPDEIWEHAMDDILAGLTLPERAVPPIVVALVVAAVGLVVRWAWRRARRSSRSERSLGGSDAAYVVTGGSDSHSDSDSDVDSHSHSHSDSDSDVDSEVEVRHEPEPQIPAEPER